MKLDPARWRALAELLDHALDLEEPARAAWLATLSGEAATLRPLLAELLEQRARAETGDFIDTLPRFDDLPHTASPELAPGSLVGPYRLTRVLGRGGMGEVWLAERADGLLRRPVALKLPLLALSRGVLAERFARERDVLASLTHAHIARLYDAGFAADGQPYLALEYVDGIPITDYANERRLDIDARLALFTQVLDAVAHAHANLVLHRDLKPSNILVTPQGEVKLLDFGIAKLLTRGQTDETELTRLSGQALTLDYASPEQIAGAPLTTAADVYGLGVVLYELLTGERPYRLKRGSRAELEQAIASLDPVPASRAAITDAAAAARASSVKKLRRRLAGDLDTILRTALRKQPAERYAGAAALADDLARHRSKRPIVARPDSAWYTFTRFVRRNALPVTAAGAVALALLVATVISVVMMRRAEDAAAAARHEATVATAVRTFMTDLFRTNTVDQHFDKQTRDLTAAELLDRGALTIEHSLADAPAAKASLLQLFGEMYEELGLADRALAMHDKSVAQAAQVYGTQSREYALALLEKAWVSNLMDKTTDAPLRMVRQAKGILGQVAPGSEDYAEALYMESHMLQSNDPDAAVVAGEESVRIMDRLGATTKRSAFARMELGAAYRAQGDLVKAARTLGGGLAEFEKLYGPEHPNVGMLHASLAVVLQLDLRLSEAEKHYREAVDIVMRYPFQARRAATVYQTQHSVVLAALGRFDEAYATLDAAEAARHDAHDSFAYSERQVRVNRGELRVMQGDAARGIAEMETAFADRSTFTKRSLTPEPAVYEYLTRGYLLAGDLAQARTAADRARDTATRDGVPPARGIWIALRQAEVTAQEGRPDAALRIVDETIARYPVAARNLSARMQLALTRARIASAAGRAEDVLQALAPWLDGPLPPGVTLPHDVRGEMQLLAGEALARSTPARAKDRLREAESTLQANDVPASPRLARVRRDLTAL